MAADSPDAKTEQERESRINLALLRGALENLRTNRKVAPLVGLAMALMFSQWVAPIWLAAWYAHFLLGIWVQLLVIHKFPSGELTPDAARRWTWAAAAANLFFVANLTSLGWYLWVPANPANHVLITIVLVAALAAQATVAGVSRQIAVPAFILYGVVMALVPLQAHSMESVYLAIVTPFYAWYIAFIAKQHHIRARAALVLLEERNTLLAELVMAKIESDRGRERAEAASLAKSQFLANMSHELRTPLNAILGFSEVISSRMFHDLPERNYEYARLINQSGHHLLTLINDVLDLAKIEAGRWKLEESDTDLHKIADEALQLVQWRAKDSDTVLENAIDPQIDLVYADERALKQILLNLLSNAVKFTPAQGRITAFAHREPDGGMVFGVNDTGIGIAAEDQGKVFDSFGQGKHDIAIADKGTGLGLAIVKGLVESHGGHVSLQSEVGKGTRVTVHLPESRVRARQPANGELAHFVA
ncbi:MAG TPA: HAMP domain-containing sensor histidine kinase [Rhizomicrobium sp.]|nr:HAMP domain-containing sensor histidine kinase [Rhizomicrobium sp.]